MNKTKYYLWYKFHLYKMKFKSWFNKHFTKFHITDSGLEYYHYLWKVFNQDYEPVSMRDQRNEQILQDDMKQFGWDRKTTAANIMYNLLPYIDDEELEEITKKEIEGDKE